MWTHKNKVVNKIPKGKFGFIYKISQVDETGKIINFYIGSKQFYSNRTKKLSKKRSIELYSGRGKRPSKEKVQSESDWKTYMSSSNTVKKLITEYGYENFKFEILEYAVSRADLHLKELSLILKLWQQEGCLNLNIKFNIYKKNL